MYQLLIIVKTDGRVATSIASFENHTALTDAIGNLRAFNSSEASNRRNMVIEWVRL